MVPRSLRALTLRAVAAACAVLSAPSLSFAQSNPSAPQPFIEALRQQERGLDGNRRSYLFT
jgi:hypothetical protein